MTHRRARAIAFYLPQFHPIPENDEWWEPGFTEWTNVTKARPLYRGHYQPDLPADLGFYDLRVPETRAQQAVLARASGIEGFCYWHYWFAGRRILERPFAEVLASNEPDFGICLGWANQTWTGIWHGAPGRILIEQTYPGEDDHRAHFEAVLPALRDPRYVRVDDRPLFYIYHPDELPEPQRFVELWQRLARDAGLRGIHFVGEVHSGQFDPREHGFDARVRSPFTALPQETRAERLKRRVLRRPHRWPLQVVAERHVAGGFDETDLPCVLPGWDNTPRSGLRGLVLDGDVTRAFRRQLEVAVAALADAPPERRLLFVKSWNEWAEGNHLEPDRRFGYANLHGVRSVLAGN